MNSIFPAKNVVGVPPCPSCGSTSKVVRMPDSLTPFERPNMRVEEMGGRYYCQACGHDFQLEPGE